MAPCSLFIYYFSEHEYSWRDIFNPDVVYKSCYICRQKFPGLHQLTKHLRSHYSEANILFDCLECSKKFPSGLLLHEHMRFHFNEEDVAEKGGCVTTESSCYKCQFCSQLKFSTAKNFSQHMLQIHNKKPFQCADCGIGNPIVFFQPAVGAAVIL